MCRQVWRRDRLEHDGDSYHIPLPAGQGLGLGKAMKLMDEPVRERIPIHVAALGAKNVAMTAELCEGWLPLHFWPDRAGDVWGAALADGLSRRPADMPPLDIVAGGPLAIGDDVEHLREQGPTDAGDVLRWDGCEGQELLQRRAARATASSRPPTRSRTPTSAATARRPRRWCPRN